MVAVLGVTCWQVGRVVYRSSQIIQLGFVPSDSRSTPAPFCADGEVGAAGWQWVMMNKGDDFIYILCIYIKNAGLLHYKIASKIS